MGCYLVPTAALGLQYILNRKHAHNEKHQRWLQQLLLGGAIFGVVDHLWNGELFLFGANTLLDLGLGVTITAVIFGVWGLLVWKDKHTIAVPTPESDD